MLFAALTLPTPSLKLDGGNLEILVGGLVVPVPLAFAPPVAALTLLIINISGVCALLALALKGLIELIPFDNIRIVGLSAPARPYPICDMDELGLLRPPGEEPLMCTVGTGIIDRLGGRGGCAPGVPPLMLPVDENAGEKGLLSVLFGLQSPAIGIPENISALLPTETDRPGERAGVGILEGVFGLGRGVIVLPKTALDEGVCALDGGRDETRDGVLNLELDPLIVLEKERGGGGPWN